MHGIDVSQAQRRSTTSECCFGICLHCIWNMMNKFFAINVHTVNKYLEKKIEIMSQRKQTRFSHLPFYELQQFFPLLNYQTLFFIYCTRKFGIMNDFKQPEFYRIITLLIQYGKVYTTTAQTHTHN